MRQRGQTVKRAVLGLTAALLASSAGLFPLVIPNVASAVDLQERTLALSTDLASATGVSYTISFSGQSGGVVGSIRLQLCIENPFPGYPCTAPAGLDMRGASLVSQTNMTGFTVNPGSQANELILVRNSVMSTAGLSKYVLQGITNPSQTGTIYGRLETFASSDATGPSHDAGGLAISINPNGVQIQTYVPPFLIFCIGNTISGHDCSTADGNYIDFGTLSSTTTATGHTLMLVATNDDYGYNITAEGTTLTSGINVIPAITNPDVSRKGVSQFGMNLRANSTPSFGDDPSGIGLGSPTLRYNQPNYYTFTSGDTLASYSQPDDFRMYSVNYIVNVSKDQAPGVYVTTLTYIATATY